jgi:hypothetical protein
MMKTYRFILSLTLVVFLISGVHFGFAAGLGDIIKGAQKALGGSGGLTNDEIIGGLKEALQVGTEKTVALVSQADGYYKNPDIKIPLPESVQKLDKLLRAAGYGEKVDNFELSMNRAAERAAPEAQAIFGDAIKHRLEEIFKPIVEDAMGEVGVTRSFQDLNAKAQSIPFGKSMSFDLDQYVTDGALDGLFKMLAEQEKLIRTDPAARVTDLLKKVFASQ